MFPYNALASEDDVDSGEPTHDKREATATGPRRWKRTRRCFRKYAACLNVLLFCVSLFILALCVWLQLGGLMSTNWCLKQTSSPSPVLSSILVPVISKYMNITLLQREKPSIFRQEPSDKVDEAWSQLGDTRLFPLQREDVLSVGKNPAEIVRFPESFGLGEAYAGRLEVFHQIHCLDALRREAYFEHYYSKAYPNGWNDTSEMHRLHLSHCIEYLLESILCQASTDIYTHVWTDGVSHPFPNFHNNRKCRDYNAIKKWHDRNAVDVAGFVDLTAPEGAKVHRVNRQFKDVHGFFKMHNDNGDHGSEIF